jgi:F-type H+-transporting ATPase subunit epsilon
MQLNVTIISPFQIIFKGQANSVILPGEVGVFEVLPFHRRMMTRLLGGQVNVDGRHFEIMRGAVRIERNEVTIVLEQNSPGPS